MIGTRANQEDYFASVEIGDGALSIVSDGMGGYEGGEVASQISVKSFVEFFTKDFDTQEIGDLLIASTHYANSKIAEAKEQNPSLEEMGSTLVAVYMTTHTLYWVSVGDSLLYKYSATKLKRVNADHSVAGDLQKRVDAGEMSQEEANSQPNRHALTSAMTGYEIPHIEQSSIKVDNSDRFIITSDGIHTLSDSQITHTASRISDHQTLADTLIDLVTKKRLKNQDNTTIVILQSKEEIEASTTTNEPNEAPKSSIKTFLLVTVIIVLLGIILFLVYDNKEDPIVVDENETNTSLQVVQEVIIEENGTAVEHNLSQEHNATLPPQSTDVISDVNATLDTNITIDNNSSLEKPRLEENQTA